MGVDSGSVAPISNQSIISSTAATEQNASEVNGSTKIGSIKDLQEKAPQLYQALVMGIAMQIRGQQEAAMRRFKEAQRKMRE